MTKPANLARLYYYPVKGMSPHSLGSAELEPGKGLPDDRRFGIAHGSSIDLPPDGGWAPKSNFVQLANCARLAAIGAEYEAESGYLALKRDGRQIARANITTPLGRTIIEDFLRAFLADETRGAPRLTEASGDAYTDSRTGRISLINLASVKDLERVVGGPVDPLRFRGNLYLDDLPAWEEFTWQPETRIAIGSAVLKIGKRIDRCAATNVNPATAERDANIPLALRRGFNHIDMGVYAIVEQPGRIAPGDSLEILT
ncbi:MAG: MOSC domain-containing protein [Alphaproteobacteria bacterium]|nr:MOSC domain-containing protein [Alphaproteobacteria bacterium]MBU0795988.1 MOSC domain-containing protein [Alphaproteobacteria bacterium]MBU0888053.1 MOSC domain-containing protein [Alphaproteobacteria bacterium]MBU1812988.1 MOSC domain-containing protein [Alphaproteobacteria bacterium]MBU2089648.1 MOSC domain-containing protein [Alphaproteobacteria bacterium]